MRDVRLAVLTMFLASFAGAALAGPVVHTYSIVARDPKTGEMGVAVQSHWFSVGSIVTWGEAGVGVVATQSIVDRGLRRERAGPDAPLHQRAGRAQAAAGRRR